MEEKLTIRFRVGSVFKNCYSSLYLNNDRILHKKRLIMAPGEMEQLVLTKEQLEKYSDLKKITIKIEEE